MSKKYLALLPRDGFFIKDGRGWNTSTSGRGHGIDWPLPSTLLGALRALWGHGEEERTSATFTREIWRERTKDIQLGKTIALRKKYNSGWKEEDVIWPVPSDALWLKDAETNEENLHRLNPERQMTPTLGRDDKDAREKLWRPNLPEKKKPLPAPRWWKHKDFISWLAGKAVSANEKRFVPARRVQIHVKMNPETQTAEEGALFSHDVIETLDHDSEWAFGVEVDLPSEISSRVAALGSGARLMHVESLSTKLFDPPADLLNAFDQQPQGIRIMTVSPTCFKQGWLPDGLEERDGEYHGKLEGLDYEIILRAALMPRPLHVFGWDMVKNEPKSISRMVPPGSVYFFERADGKPFNKADAKALWLYALGERTNEGFGRIVPGIWNQIRKQL